MRGGTRCLAIAFCGAALWGQGAGDLMVGPTRIILEGRTRSAEVTLVHRGKARATYRIGFVEMDMTEAGNLVERPRREGERSAADLVRFSPRQIDLEPGIAQTVRMQARLPEGLPPGEYRSHLVFRALPPGDLATALGGANQQAQEAKTLSVAVFPIYGISIPIILRHGKTHAEVRLEALRVEASVNPKDPKAPPGLVLQLHREGNRGEYGEVAVSRVEASGRELPLGLAKGVAIYNNLAKRLLTVPIGKAGQAGTLKGRLKASFTPMGAKQPSSTAFLDLP